MGPAIIPRPYQLDTAEWSRALIGKGVRRFLIVNDVGSGKTICACIIMQATVAKGNRCLFLAPSRELVSQCSRKLREFGVPHGVIMAGHGYNTDAPVQVSSIATLLSRAVRSSKIPLPQAEVIIFDEAHVSMAPVYLKLLKMYPKAVIIGLTATPCRMAGHGLGDFYQGIIQVIQRSELIRGGYVVPTECYAPYVPNLKPKKGEKVLDSNGDYRSDFLAPRMDQPTLVGDIVSWWQRLGEDRPTICIASSINHSLHIRDEFLKAGIAAHHIDGKTEDNEREDVLGAATGNGLISDGKVKVLNVFGVGLEGLDLPCLGTCIFARPTKSVRLLRQGTGRIVRPYVGPLYVKHHGILLDHAGVIYQHMMLPDDDITWELAPGKTIQEKVKEECDKGERQVPITCPKCHTVFPYKGSLQCPTCGHVVEQKRQAAPAEKKDGVLVKVTADDFAGMPPEKHRIAVRVWHKCLGASAARDTPLKAAVAHFKSETGAFPWQISPPLPNVPESADMNKKTREKFPNYYRGRT